MKHRAKSSAGYTLVEVMVAMTISAGLLTLVVTLLVRMIAANSAAEDHLHGVIGLTRLGEQFRRDACDATNAVITEVDGRVDCLTMTLGDESQVAYEIAPAVVVRRKSSADQLVHREGYRLGPVKPIGFSADAAGTGEVSITLARVTARQGEADVENGRFKIRGIVAGNRAGNQRP